MKRYLTAFFIGLSVIILLIGLQIDLYWSGALVWGLAIICLLLAAYYSRYIPNDKNSKNS
ncbi:hypothetical protein KFZ58_03425 [Virgibacillus sp. NKC19-16]|uniref:hypothetical protein n=1 Tax=Virgibacillus salidurans TaxID=2831673 RepID=UPI001F1F1FEB|nr:hypothetical protein [Virgibacillus sp. NKC19-16]UJL47007.1 hypothetical protein KFZ58_03425 [Virgibacillus sp. NKC19-16]